MLPFGIGLQEVIVVLVVVLLVIGPNKLPDVAKTLGKGVRAARRAGNELRNALTVDEPTYPPARPWAQPDTVADAEPVVDPSWACDGEGNFDPETIAGLAATVQRSDDADLEPADVAPEGQNGDPSAPAESTASPVAEDALVAAAESPLAKPQSAADRAEEEGELETTEANRVDG
jgi:TatA/E family protein of Tat protein translocase